MNQFQYLFQSSDAIEYAPRVLQRGQERGMVRVSVDMVRDLGAWLNNVTIPSFTEAVSTPVRPLGGCSCGDVDGSGRDRATCNKRGARTA